MTDVVDNVPAQSLYLQSPENLRLHILHWQGPQHAPAVLLTHGFTHHAWVWEPIALQLQQHFDVYALDFRGHGDSQWDEKLRYLHGQLQSDIEQTIEQLQLHGCHLVGHSLGARVASLLLAEKPHLARSFTIIDTGPEVVAAGVAKMRKDAETQTRVFPSATHYYNYLRKVYSLADRAALRTFAHHSLRESNGEMELKLDPAFTQVIWNPAHNHNDARDLRAPLTEQLWSALSRLQMPVLVMRGAASAILSHAIASKMACDVIPNATFHTVPTAGHAVMLDNPAAVAATIEHFLQQQ